MSKKTDIPLSDVYELACLLEKLTQLEMEGADVEKAIEGTQNALNKMCSNWTVGRVVR
jgi:hypothetical protein